MLDYALVFFIVALIAAFVGMRGMAGFSAEIGYVLVFVSLVFVIIAVLSGHAPVVAP